MIYLNSNGKILEANQASIEAGSRAYLYGDGLFESIRVFAGKPINVQQHIGRLLKGASVMKMQVSHHLNDLFFEEKIMELLEKSEIKQGGKIRLSLDRKPGGNYLPTSNEVVYLIEVFSLDYNDFELNPKGLDIDIYRDIKFVKNSLSNYKTKNRIISVMASIGAQELNLDEVLLISEKGNIIESASSNVFIVSNGVLYTPGLDEGCLAGAMRMQIINLAIQNGIKVYECPILPQHLLSADEVFFTNSIKGIQWVGGYRTKRYLNHTARRLILLLNAHWNKETGSNYQ